VSSRSAKIDVALFEPRTERESPPSAAAGLAFAAANIIISALQPVITRYGALRIDPLLFCAASVGISAVCAVAMLIVSGEIRLLADRRYLPKLWALSMAGTVATSLALIYGLRRLDAVAAVILLESEPIYSLILAGAFLHERPSPRQLVATMVIVAAIGWVFGTGRAFKPLYAAALIIVTPLFWQTSHVISLSVMPPLAPRVITGARYVYAAMVFAVVLLAAARTSLAQLAYPSVLIAVTFTGAFVFFLGSFTWYGAISRLPLARTTAIVIPAVPIASFIFAIVFLGEQPSRHELIGIAVAVIGVIVLVTGTGARKAGLSQKRYE
jgi:drug/metabolite transporter (DMT)-like permease